MPQDFPLEASETLVFTPSSLRDISNAPSFVLRAATPRDKRFHRRLITEEGLRTHNTETIRKCVLDGLRQLWEPQDYDRHAPIITDYWQQQDDFVLQRKDNPELEWSFDPEIQSAVGDLTQRVAEAYPPLRRMLADNNDFGEMIAPVLAAVVVQDIRGLSINPRRDRGYFTVDTMLAVQSALEAFERKHQAEGLKEGTAWVELFVACSQRMRLDEEEAKNSASPSQSSTIQPPLMETGTEEDGKSPAPANLTEIQPSV